MSHLQRRKTLLYIAILLPLLLWYHIRICFLDSKGYYAILGIPEKAKYTEIRAAYRLLAKKYHPDRNNSDFAEDMIKKINAVFEVLSNRDKKSEYDQTVFDIGCSHKEDK